MISQIYETENSNYSNIFRNCINSVQKLLANRNTDDAFRYVSSSKGKLSMEKEKFNQKEYVKQWTKSNMKAVGASYKTEFVKLENYNLSVTKRQVLKRKTCRNGSF